MSLTGFDPVECLVTVEVEPRPLEPAFPEDALMRATAKAVAVDEEGDPQTEQVYGTLQWKHVGYGAALNGGCPSWEVADLEADLLSLHEVLFNEEDRLREDFDEFGGFGSDLLVIDRLTVSEELDFQSVAGALLKHVVTHFGSGCFGAAYIEDARAPNPVLRELLLEQGFEWHPQEGWGFFLLDLGAVPPDEREPQERDPSAQ